MKTKNWIKWLAVLISIVFIGACSNGGTDDPLAVNDTNDGTTGYLALGLIDAPGGSYQAVYVSIKEVQVCIAPEECDGFGDCAENCEWETIAEINQTYNLLELVNGVTESLGLTELETGQYNQMRLMLSDTNDGSTNILGEVETYPQYLIDDAGVVHEMKVPSGYQSGIKLVHPFQIVAGLTTELILDFDVSRSVVKAGNSGKYNLKPTIKVIGTHSRAIVTGTVTTQNESLVPLKGATVTAWQEIAEGEWSAAMTTATDADGGYMLYLDPGDYKIVTSAYGYMPQCKLIFVEGDKSNLNIDFELQWTPMVTVTGTVSGITDSESDNGAPDVSISFSKQIEGCLPDPMEVAVTSTTIDDNSDNEDYYNIEDGSFMFLFGTEIAPGSYVVTFSWDNKTKGSTTVDILESMEIVFPEPEQEQNQ